MTDVHQTTLPIDHPDRQRLESDLDRTFFVEAGAGTGKTTTLVARIVALVRTGKVDPDHLAAITFTEAAATELRDRVRRGLENASRDPSLAADARTRCRDAAGQVDLATIQTIHAFAGTLLRTFSIEAGLPPAFAVWDDVELDLAFEERFRAWLYDEVPDERPDNLRRRNDVRRALLLGMTYGQLRALAAGLQEHVDLLSMSEGWRRPEPPGALALARRWGEEALGARAYLELARDGEADPLAHEVKRIQFAASRMASARTEDEAIAALQGYGRPSLTAGKLADWRSLPDGTNPVRVIREAFKSSRDEIEAALAAHRAAALGALLLHLRDFTLDFARWRRQQGAASFHDLLIWARDLLRDHPEVRAQARERFQRIFVDEFQDTDPLQAEIVWCLGAEPGAPSGRDQLANPLVPGKIFVVGDPKQSIYRFRGADIALYSRIYEQADVSSKVRLTQNFRSVAPVLDWVNHHFRCDMRERAGVQATYVDLHPASTAADLSDSTRGVYVVGGKVDGSAERVWLEEAEHVAAIAQRAVSTGWIVRDPADGQLRPAHYRDVCLLMPGRTNVRRLEDAFAARGVPYRIESGSLVLATQEVRDLLSCLRAIDDPSDQVALVAALRSPAYACSDVDLLSWIEAGGRLDYERPRDGLGGPVAEAFDSLRRFHADRAGRSPATTIEAFVRERMLAVQVFGQLRPREAWRRIRYVVAQARRFAADGRPSLRGLVDWLEGLQRVGIRGPESPAPESDEDAVRVLTIHGAKGLEFPIVILTGLGSQRKPPPASVRILPDRSTGAIDVQCGVFQTPGFEAANEAEKTMDEAEHVRLLYVAATRARDHLVLSLFHAKGGCEAARIVEVLGGYDPSRYQVIETFPSLATNGVDRPIEQAGAGLAEWETSDDAPAPATVIDRADEPLALPDLSPEEHARDEGEWLRRRQQLVDDLTNLSMVAASSLSRLGAAPSDRPRLTAGEVEPETVDSAASDDGVDDTEFLADEVGPPSEADEPTALGRAVHQVLERMASTESSAFDGLVKRAAIWHRIPGELDEVKRLALAAAASPAVREAWESARCWREVPAGAEVAGKLLLGRIDLLWEKTDGSLGIVDYKTDRVDRHAVAARAAEYRAQGGAYALAIERATGQRVSSVAFVFAALDGHTEVYRDVPALIEEARSRIR
ncbi:MAG: UvrD-helicase domain-containing protein [Chloroflexota bacterium]